MFQVVGNSSLINYMFGYIDSRANLLCSFRLVSWFRSNDERISAINGCFCARSIYRMCTFCYALVFVFATFIGSQRYVMRVYNIDRSNFRYNFSFQVFNFNIDSYYRGAFKADVSYRIVSSERLQASIPTFSALYTFRWEGVFFEV